MYIGHPSLSTLCRQLPPKYEAILSTLSDKPGNGVKFASWTPKPRTAYNTGSLLYCVATGYTSTPFSVLHFTVSVSCFTASSCAGQEIQHAVSPIEDGGVSKPFRRNFVRVSFALGRLYGGLYSLTTFQLRAIRYCSKVCNIWPKNTLRKGSFQNFRSIRPQSLFCHWPFQ